MDSFSSLTVLSMEQATTLPFLTLRLAEEGMRVIRLENPPRGDPNRWVGREVLPDPEGAGFEKGMNAYYLPNNLGKQAITLNLRYPEGQALLHQLIKELPVDIFATNQRPRSYKKLGIDYSTLAALQPGLIWVGISGFGPGHDEAAYDPILQARAGFMDLTGEADGDPMVFGLPMVDLGAAEHAYGQVMKALYWREKKGEGMRLDISMFQSAVSWMVSPVMLTKSFDENVSRQGNIHQFFAPVKVYPTADGYIYLAVGTDRQWESLTRVQGFTGLARQEYATNAGRIADVHQLNREMDAITARQTTAELIKALHHAGIPVSKVNRIEDVCFDPLVADLLVSARDPRTGVEISIAPPAVVSDFLQEQGMKLGFPPRLGEHNDDIFGVLGYDGDDLRDRGVI
jgi:formyl-CoA transferase